MSLLWTVVPAEVGQALRRVSQVLADSDFYLAGGTALALRFGHRVSVDLDLFSATFNDPRALAARCIQALPGLRVTLEAPRTLDIDLDGVQISFFGYSYPPLAPPDRSEVGIVPLASLDDSAAMKLAAISSRGSRKDFVDMWWLLHHHRPLVDCLDLYRRKFAGHDFGHVIRALAYFDDADEEPELNVLAPPSWDVIKRDLVRSVSAFIASQGSGGDPVGP